MTMAIAMRGPGGPDVLQPIAIDVPDPGPGEIRIRQSVVGVNFVDIYYRTGLYPLAAAPAVLGFEGAGTVEAVGRDVTALKPGDRVAYHGRPIGAYAEARILPEGRLVTLPDTLSDRVMGGTMLRGLTAHMLLHAVCAVRPGDWILVHAAAGGLGQLVTRWAKRLGARVIGTVGTADKQAQAEAAGADAVFLRGADDWVARTRALADGRGVHLAIDGIGGGLLTRTLAAVRPFGIVASIGQVAGPIPPVRIADLSACPSVALVRPSVIAYADGPDRYRSGCADLIAALQDGLINPIGAEYPLRDAALAQADLEAGRTTGSVILTV
ncbi:MULTISPECIES: quinone oxidoreductase family protein [unclassified Methylobacterium]|jgi:NADPH2:quinone reductase|uniref:quinone oxidoreductase family protein n=1 Tax=unclassified Methylobacterium TaxID=2615210 RepID=UPI001353478A|nr:quinone oxidoreductase [Methylobacterium sp. 2A]MWV21375.1 quinone oxidoreductase [Methylobacterium sp. 2A]